MKISYLEWDSKFFDKKIGKVELDFYDPQKLSKLLDKARKDNYQLIYLFAPEHLFLQDDILRLYNGKLMDRKVLYRMDFESCHPQSNRVIEYSASEPTNELVQLCYLSGVHSRFNTDENFSTNDFHRLYYTWLCESIKKQIADNTFIIEDKEAIRAMVTLKKNDAIGQIGLLSVSTEAQKKGYGKLLIEASKQALFEKGIFSLEIPTQLANQNACQFYEHCGFYKLSISNIYHFWL
jgi:Acetyltransferase (GNAT) family.